ncbi:MAG: PTS sugar transporter subunit IIB [Solobacterium sp.]|nr:PTS sugar transporter subunit IIB [Solobacterium sp.]
MEDKRILLCCGAGMSSGFLATSTAKAAKELGYDWYVTAKSQSVAIDEMPDYDACLLGPHYESHLQEFKDAAEEMDSDVAIAVIPQKVYGNIDGKALVEFALQVLKEAGKA